MKIEFELKFGDVSKKVNIVVPLAIVLGDTVSSDQLCSTWRSSLRTCDTMISRACFLPSFYADDPWAKCSFKTNTDVVQHIEEDGVTTMFVFCASESSSRERLARKSGHIDVNIGCNVLSLAVRSQYRMSRSVENRGGKPLKLNGSTYRC